MVRLLKPLLQAAPHPILTSMVPNLTVPEGSASRLLSTSWFTAPPAAEPCSPQRADAHSLLDSGDAGGEGLPRCLLPIPHSPKRPDSSPSASAMPTNSPIGDNMEKTTVSNFPSAKDEPLKGPLSSQSPQVSPNNVTLLPSLQDQPPLPSNTPSPSLSFSVSLTSSPSFSPCPSRPTSCGSRGLLPPPHFQDTPPPPSSHCSAPSSVSSSPGGHRLRPSLSIPITSTAAPFHPSTLSLPLSLDFGSLTKRDAQTPTRSNPQRRHEEVRATANPQEVEMQEWGRQGEERKTSTEDFSFIDEEDPAL